MKMGEESELEQNALGWLLRVEAIHDPGVQHILLTSVLTASKQVKTAELGVDQSTKTLVVLVKLQGSGEATKRVIMERLRKMLPSYAVAITENVKDFNDFLGNSNHA